jgi:hypothetical protein
MAATRWLSSVLRRHTWGLLSHTGNGSAAASRFFFVWLQHLRPNGCDLFWPSPHQGGQPMFTTGMHAGRTPSPSPAPFAAVSKGLRIFSSRQPKEEGLHALA